MDRPMSGAPKPEPLSPEAVAFREELLSVLMTREQVADHMARLFDVHRVNAHASLVAALRGLEDKSEPGRFCDHAAAPCHRCDAAAAALAGAQKGESRD